VSHITKTLNLQIFPNYHELLHNFERKIKMSKVTHVKELTAIKAYV